MTLRTSPERENEHGRANELPLMVNAATSRPHAADPPRAIREPLPSSRRQPRDLEVSPTLARVAHV